MDTDHLPPAVASASLILRFPLCPRIGKSYLGPDTRLATHDSPTWAPTVPRQFLWPCRPVPRNTHFATHNWHLRGLNLICWEEALGF